MAQRTLIPDFSLANPLYVGATVSAYTVGEDGAKTATLATLFADETSTTELSNPQTLDSEGKFAQPVYIEEAVILTISGLSVPDHDTGTIRPDLDQGELYAAVNRILAYIIEVQAAVSEAQAAEQAALAAQAAAEAAAAGLKWRPSVKAASTGNLTLSGEQIVDGVSLVDGDRILVKDQSDTTENGVYIVAAGTWSRAEDADTWDELISQVVTVEEGAIWADYSFVCQINQGGTLGSTPVTWGTLKIVIPDASVTPEKLTVAARKQFIEVAASDETTAIAAGTGKITFRLPYAFTLTEVRASLTTAQTSGNVFTVDINQAGSSVLSTKLTIDNGEKTSTTAATPAEISDADLADDAEITVDVDQIGDGTAKGLKVTLIGYPA